MPDETHDISLPELAATLQQHTQQIGGLDQRVVKLESQTVNIDHRLTLTDAHLTQQDRVQDEIKASQAEIKNGQDEIRTVIIGDGSEEHRGIVRILDEVKHDVKLWNLGFWFVVSAIITAILGGVAFAVASYIIHR